MPQCAGETQAPSAACHRPLCGYGMRVCRIERTVSAARLSVAATAASGVASATARDRRADASHAAA